MRPFVLALGAFALVGCDAHIPMPEAALLKSQPPPRCETRAETGARKQGPTATEGGDAAALKRLDYEAQCYRHAEMIARNRLGKLQESVQEAGRAIKRGASANP